MNALYLAQFGSVAMRVLLVIACCRGVQAQNTTVYIEQGQLVRANKTIQALGDDLMGDKVSLYTGSLEFVQTDVSIPGNDALPVAVARRYEASFRRAPGVEGLFVDWELEIPHLHGTYAGGASYFKGWVVPANSNLDPNRNQRCSNFGPPPDAALTNFNLGNGTPIEYDKFWSGHMLYVPGQGDEKLLSRDVGNTAKPTDGRTYNIVTKSNWQFRCISLAAPQTSSGEGFLAIAPNGTSYRFDWMVRRGAMSMSTSGGVLGRNEIWILPTLVTDRFGNTVTYNYDASDPWKLTSIVASDGRRLDLGYVAGTRRVASVSDGSRTWRYLYQPIAAGSTTHRLSRVMQPDASSWTFAMAEQQTTLQFTDPNFKTCISSTNASWATRTPIAAPRTSTITHPSGAVASFTLATVLHGRSNFSTNPCPMPTGVNYDGQTPDFAVRSITSKSLSGPGIPTMTWNYAWGPANASWACGSTPCARTKTLTVTDPRGIQDRHTFGTDSNATAGQQLLLEEGYGTGGAARITASTYGFSPAPYPRLVGWSGQADGGDLFEHSQNPLSRRVITQDGATFNWQATAFDAFARPTNVSQWSSLGYSRMEVSNYFDLPSRWILGQKASTTVAGIDTQRISFDPTTGLPLASYAFGKLKASYQFSSDGTLYRLTDGLDHTTTYTNYKRGLAQNILHPDGTTESAVVDDAGLVIRHINAAGTFHDYGYDLMGRLARITYPAGDPAAYHPTTLRFEPVGESMGLSAGHWRQTVVTGNAVHTTDFDALWRPRLTRTCDATIEPGTCRAVQQRWDADGHKTFESYPQRDIASVDVAVPGTGWAFDALGRATAQFDDSELGLLSTRTEYLPGFVKQVVNPRGVATRFRYQAFDTPSEDSIRQINGPRGLVVNFDRDVFGKALAITRTGNDGGSVTRRYAYDLHQRLCLTAEPETGATLQGYDSANNLAWRASGLTSPEAQQCGSVSIPATRVVSFGYDARNRLITTSYGDGSPSVGRSYTSDGLPWKLWTAGNVWTYAYNNRRMLVTEELGFEGFGWRFDHEIDAYGHKSSLKYPNGAVVSQVPNALGEPTRVPGYAEGVTHHPNGALAGYTLANGVAHTSQLNTRGLPQQWLDTGLVHDTYSYDHNGNVKAIIDLATGTRSRTMAYDELDRLTVANGVWGAGSYRYDALDNLRASTVGARSLQHNIDAATNRLTSLTGSQNVSIAYDAQGNLVQRGLQSFAFDIGNRLRAAAGKASYTYDGHGRRMLTTYADGSRKLQFYGLEGKLMYTWQGSQGGTRHVYLGGKLIAETNNVSGTTYVHTDALGSPVARTHALGGLVSRTEYEPYGNFAAGVNPTNVGFTGHVNDPDTGLIYMQQRYYDPMAGRFLSVDPVVTKESTGGHFNRYVYGNNNPYKFKDPDGRAAETPWDAANVAIGALSLVRNLATGNYVGSAVDAVGIVVDVAATAVPGFPGGAATAIQALRATDRVADAAKGVGEVAKKPPVVIGEGMKDRVIPTAKEIGGTYYKPRGEWTAVKQERWANEMKRQEARGEREPHVDLGRDPERQVPSKAYELERRVFDKLP